MRALAISFFLLFVAAVAWAEFQVPPLTGPVVDDAGILDSSTRAALERGLYGLREKGGSQINVLTVKSLEEMPIEQAGIKVFDTWKLGGTKTDNGALLLVAPNERRVRIEVGQGLEGSLTDADSKRIIEEAILPLFRSGDFNSGVLVGVYQIVRKTDPDFDLKPYLENQIRRPARGNRGGGLPGWLVILIILAFFIFRGGGGGGRRFRRSGIYYGGWGGGFGGGFGSGGGFGGGGGGWSGGGGSGSGGGASGGW